MEESIEKRIPKIVFEIFIILFGYCILIVLFSLVGYQISSDKLIFGNLLSTSNNFLDIFKNLFNSIPKPIRFFVIILTPIYLHRALLYDTDVKEHDSKQDQILKISNWFPFLFFIVLVIFSFVYFWTVENIDYDKFWDISIKILLVFVPYLFFIGYRVLCKDSEFKEKFKYRTLFPAIFTGLFSFLFGWAINIDISISGWAIIFSWVLFYLIFSASIRFKTVSKSGESIDHNRKVINIAVSLLSPLFLAALFSTYPSGEIAKIICMGVILTLTVGITETWYVVEQVLSGKLNYKYGIEFYHPSSLLVMSVIYPLFLFSLLFEPLQNVLFFILIVLYLLLGYLFWLRAFQSSRFKIQDWGRIRLIFGYILPIIILISLTFDLDSIHIVENNYTLISLSFSLMIVPGAFFLNEITNNSIFSFPEESTEQSTEQNKIKYIDIKFAGPDFLIPSYYYLKTRALALLGITTFGIIFFLFSLKLLVNFYSQTNINSYFNEESFNTNLTLLTIGLFLIYIVTFISYLYYSFSRNKNQFNYDQIRSNKYNVNN